MPYVAHTPVDLTAVPPQGRSLPVKRVAEKAAPAQGESHWEAEARRLRTALEDVVALANGSADLRHRLIQMQRRAIAALSGVDREVGRNGGPAR